MKAAWRPNKLRVGKRDISVFDALLWLFLVSVVCAVTFLFFGPTSKGVSFFAFSLCLISAVQIFSRKFAIVCIVLAVLGTLIEWPDIGGNRSEAIALAMLLAFAAASVVRLKETGEAAQARLRTSEEKYRQLVEKSLAGIFLYRDDRILYANSRFKEIVGHLPEDVIGKEFWQFVHEEDRPRIHALRATRQKDGATDLRYECRLIDKDGRTVWVEITSSPAEYEGHRAVLVIVYNISAQKEIEEQRRELSRLMRKQEEQLVHSTRLAEMGEMAAGVAHELNQPLTGIKNFARNAAYMLDEGVGNTEEIKENLRLISSQVDRASKIISQMRELARRTERHLSPVDINNTLRESIEFVMPQLKLSGVEVAFDLSPDLPEVTGDRIRLEQVFLNLLTNARQAMEEAPERQLRVTTRYDPDGTWPVVVEVVDTGKGFAPDVAEKLFQPFFSTKKASHGTGLGLSISLSIIKDHRGTIEAVGAEGEGATFIVRLPVGEPPEVQNGKSGQGST
jgi:PAS domain S-box-containing protein